MKTYTKEEVKNLVDHFGGYLESEESYYREVTEKLLIGCTNYNNFEELEHVWIDVQNSIEEGINQYPENWQHLLQNGDAPQEALNYYFSELLEY